MTPLKQHRFCLTSRVNVIGIVDNQYNIYTQTPKINVMKLHQYYVLRIVSSPEIRSVL